MAPNQIKQLRESLQMTQEEFARRLGLQTRGAVSLLESGSREPRGPLLQLLRLLAERAATVGKNSR